MLVFSEHPLIIESLIFHAPDIMQRCHHRYLGYVCRKMPRFLLLSSLISHWPGFSKANLFWHRAEEAWLCRSWASTIGFRLGEIHLKQPTAQNQMDPGPQKERLFVFYHWSGLGISSMFHHALWTKDGTLGTPRIFFLIYVLPEMMMWKMYFFPAKHLFFFHSLRGCWWNHGTRQTACSSSGEMIGALGIKNSSWWPGLEPECYPKIPIEGVGPEYQSICIQWPFRRFTILHKMQKCAQALGVSPKFAPDFAFIC